MSMNSAREFQKKYGINKLDSRVLQSIIESQGYTFIKFNGIADSQEVQTLTELLDVKQNIISSPCFIYQDEHQRLLFINEGLSEDERLIVLAHEEGHIWNHHMIQNTTTYSNVMQEYEANEFVHYLLHNKIGKNKRRSAVSFLCGAIVLIGIVTSAIAIKQSHKLGYTDNLYRTENGTKYHLKDCVYIKDKKNVYKLTKEEFDSGDYEACDVCLPDER